MATEQATCDICGHVGDLVTNNRNADVIDETVYKLPWGFNCGRCAPFEFLLKFIAVSMILIVAVALITEYIGG